MPKIHSDRVIVTFKSAGMHTFLGNAPARLPKECWRPSIPDLYRYSLTQNGVDVCLTGLKRREEIDAASAGVQKGKLSPAEIDYLNIYGDLHRDRLKIQNVPPERLIYQA